MHCERFAPLYRKIPNLVWLEAGAHSDFHAVRSACENSWLNLRYSPQNLLGESIPEIQENVRSQFSSASFEKRNDFTSMSLESTSIRQIKMWLLFVEPYRISRNSDSSALHDQCNFFAVVIMASLQLTQGMGKIHGCSGIRRLYHALAGQWFKRDEQIDLTTLAIFIAFSLWTFGPWQNAPPLNELQFVSSRQRTGCRGA